MDYKEKLEEAKRLYETANSDQKYVLETLFPELKEAEDERIRKEIIEFLQLPHPQFVGKRNHEKWIDWLEKQGEKLTDPRYKHLEKLLVADDIYQMAITDNMVQEAKTKAINALSELGIGKLLGLEKQGEQKSGNINVNKMVMEYSQTNDGDFGLPVNCMIRAYRQGINDVLNKE